MKNLIIIFFLAFGVGLSSCEMELVNPNAATESQVLTTKDGLYALSSGIQTVYATSALEPIVFTPSVTTRETAITTTFANLEELEQGGTNLSGENGYTVRLFNRLMRVKGMSEDLINAADNVELSDQVRANIKSWGNLFRAMSLGHLANNFEQVVLVNGDDASFSSRIDAYEEAISLLRTNIDLINSAGVSAEFNTKVGSNIDILNTSRLFLARYLLYTGEHNEAATIAGAVDISSKSVFSYDNQNVNPIYEGFYNGTVSYAPRDHFGLPNTFTIDQDDKRIDFFLEETSALSLNNLPIEIMVAPFYISNVSDIPVYVPGEADLIIAEAMARESRFNEAENALNRIINKAPEDDIFGIGADLNDTYSSNNNQSVLLKEIYKHRRIELYLTGNSLADSRRFNRPDAVGGYNSERNRNYYPYPEEERLNNPNTPPNPSI